MPTWLRETLVSISIAAITLSTFAVAIAVGVLISTTMSSGSWWVGATTAVAFLVLVALPLRLWWVMKKSRQP